MLLLSRNFYNIARMKKLLSLASILIIISIHSSGQTYYRTKNFGYSPVINKTVGGIWYNWEQTITDTANNEILIGGNPDSVYISYAGYPDFGDLIVPDLEVKMKSLWHNDSLFFLFQRQDDSLVNGLTSGGLKDTSIAEGFDNLDATKIYFYLSQDSSRTETNNNYMDSVSWIQFVWQSDKMQAKLPSGGIVDNYDDYYTSAVQWKEGKYYYAKLGIDMEKIAPYLMDSIHFQIDSFKLGFGTMGFLLEQTENDKEVMKNGKYVLQTRSYWGALIDSNAVEHINIWPWLLFMEEDSVNIYTSGVELTQADFAQIYPNPATLHINIRVDSYQEFEYEVYDIMGRLVINGEFYNNYHQISLYNLDTGSYFIRLRKKNTNATIIRKILVIR